MRTWDSKLPKNNIRQCVKQGIVTRSDLFTLRALPGVTKTHLVLVASKKAVHPHATVRNFCKRRIRAALDRIKMPIAPFDCVLFLSRAVADVEFELLVAELEKGVTTVVEKLGEKTKD
jgi:ribonuclease P protein component